MLILTLRLAIFVELLLHLPVNCVAYFIQSIAVSFHLTLKRTAWKTQIFNVVFLPVLPLRLFVLEGGSLQMIQLSL